MTDVALKEYLEHLVRDLDKRIDQRFLDTDRRYEQRAKAADQALDKAEQALREYKAGSNEWRDALKDANNRMATRTELTKLDDAVQDLRRAKANFDGRLLMLSGGISLLVTVSLWALSQVWR